MLHQYFGVRLETTTIGAIQSRRTATLLGIALFVLVCIAFQPALQNGFVSYDDAEYITANPNVQGGLKWSGIVWAFQSRESGNWHPLTRLSHLLDCEWYGLEPAGHHLTSLLIHATSTLLVFLLFRRMTNRFWPSFFLAALFGLHPLRAESVAWVAERKDVLCAFFGLCSLWAYACYVKNRKQATAFPLRQYALSLLWFACSLMSKPMIITLPLVLMLLDFWPLNRTFNRANLPSLACEKLPYILLSATCGFMTLASQANAGAVDVHFSIAYRLGNAAISYLRYLGKLVYPLELAFFYPHPKSWPTLLIAIAVILLLAASYAVVKLRHRFPFLLVGWFWYLAMLVPVIGLIQVGRQSIADRYSYLPSLGFLLGAVWASCRLVSCRAQFVRPFFTLGIGILVLCIVLTREQIRHWHDDESLARRALAVTTDNYLALDLLGAALVQQGKPAEALPLHEAALRLKPDYFEGHCHAGVALDSLGRLDEAIGHFEQALRLQPAHAETLYNFARTLERSNQLEAARQKYLACLTTRPNYADAHYNLGLLLGRMGRYAESVQAFQNTLRLTPKSADAENNLAVSLERMGRLDESVAHYRNAVELRPDYARGWFNLGVALARTQQPEAAAQCFQAALRLQPDYPEARANLGALLNQPVKP